MTDTRIMGVSVSVPAPFSTGHVCTDVEAAILNQIMAENIGNNMRAKVKEMLGGTAVAELPDSLRASIQSAVSEYAATYELRAGRTGASSTATSPLDKMIRKIVLAALKQKLKEKGIKWNDVSEEARETMIEKASTNEKIIAAAKKRLAAEEKELDLLGDLDAE